MTRTLLLTITLTVALHGAASKAQAEETAPVSLDKWGRYHVNINPYMPNPSPPKGKKVTWVPKVYLVFRIADPESDDVALLQHYRGKKKWGPELKCKAGTPIPRRGPGGKTLGYSMVPFTCLMDEKYAISKTGTFSVNVSYKQTGMGKVHKNLGRYTYQIKTFNMIWPGKRPPIKNFYADHDFRMGEAWLYQKGDGQLQIWSWFKYGRNGGNKVQGGRMRCFVGDKKLKFYESPTRRTEIYFDHYPNRKTHNMTKWGLWYWWTGRVGEGNGLDFLKANPGKYRCTLTQDGEMAREFFFEVGEEGRVKPSPCEKAGEAKGVRLLADEHMIKMTFKKGADIKFNKKAFKKSGLYGRGWLPGCPL
jgi:hypothetical protein